MGSRLANVLVVVFFAGVIGIVFQQIATSMTEQGIASGGPYDNAAAYPKAIAIIVGVLLALHVVLSLRGGPARHPGGEAVDTADADEGSAHPGRAGLVRPALLLVIFAVYLGLLNPLGYHLSTAPMLLAVMLLCGVRHVPMLIGVSLGIAFAFAFLFEHFLHIVLPGGLFALNLSW